ncbi:peptide/nickel transport system substrate-binding protein [Bacillus oleivorans]|uniref:Peptide/nickel transport system substrate-binding protein n=2 Tax=Bacillus oleivorans TaxID=1448271 RepID=A0A285CT06_9BACI|nr:peptide/nickel transport system substrate-binding protein [Bacillus oleivorans]
MKKRFLQSFVLLLALSLVLAACSSGDDSSDGGSNSDNDAAQTTLIYGRGADSTSLDPAVVTDGESLKVTENIFDTLLNYEEESTEVVAGLATEWKVSDDSLTYTFTLREDVKFHDGTDFNADAVVYNFERWMSGGTDGAYIYYAAMFGGFKEDAGHVIESVTAVDPYTVEFKLKRPQAPFLKNLAMGPFGIASPTALEENPDTFGENPVGTGPFVFKEWKRNDTITLERNSDYWGGEPKLEQVIFRVIPDNSARLTALKTGEIDLMDGVNPSDVSQVESDSSLQLLLRQGMNIGYFGFNTEEEPFDDPKVRQALNHAVDKQAIIDAFYAGNAEAAVNPMPSFIPGYNDEIEGYEYDLEKAKALLAEAGYPDGFDMELWTFTNPRDYMPEPQKIAEAIQAEFAKINVNVEIITYDWTTFLEKVQNGEAQSFLVGWIGDNGDADNFLYVLLDQDSIDGNNYSRYANQELHDILIAAQSETDEAARVELYKQAQEIIHEDAPWIPLAHANAPLAAKSNLKGFVPHPTGLDKFTNAYFE